MIVVVDYGMGNLGSIVNMLKHVGHASVVSSDVALISDAQKVILPGVGAFDAGMQSIEERGLRDVLEYKALHERIPVLGICLGAQLMTNSSDEGQLPGLRWVPAKTQRFTPSSPGALKVPHMGWNRVVVRRPTPLTENLPQDPRFYFVHSYYIKVEDEKDEMLKTTYGVEFDSGFRRDNIYGVQFHPEKSHKFGMRILENFSRL